MPLNMAVVGEYKIFRFIIFSFYTSLYQKLNGTEVECLFLLKWVFYLHKA